jgi:deoxyguanosine kinase
VIEGLIGVGKSSLCRLLREELGARLVLEPAATNPFLEHFYKDPVAFRFPVQMFYLHERWKQQAGLRQEELFDQLVVSDYTFEKDRMFAEKTLSADEFELYERFAGALGEAAPKPDALIYLEAPTEVLLQRISRRCAPGEQTINAAYIDDLRARYDALWESWTACPIVRLDNTSLNYVDDPADRAAVVKLVENLLDGGYTPGSDKDREDQQSLFY